VPESDDAFSAKNAGNHTRLPPQTPGYISPDTGAVLKTIDNPNPHLTTEQTHCLQLPQLCPASKNPGPGSTLRISYVGKQRFLEVFSLSDYIQSFIAHPKVRDVELFTQTIARDCHHALNGEPVRVQGHFELPGIGQSVTITVSIA